MSLVDRIGELLDDKGPDVIERVIERAKTLAGDYLNGPEADLAKVALDKIGAQSDALGQLGQSGLVALVARWAVSDRDGARAAYLAEGASFEERRAASHAATANAVTDRLNRERAWDEVQVMLQDLGRALFKVLPLLLAA